jgi:hypothetical protein
LIGKLAAFAFKDNFKDALGPNKREMEKKVIFFGTKNHFFLKTELFSR